MIVCKKCNQLFDDDARYCNQCQLELSHSTTDYVFDQEELKEESLREVKAQKKLYQALFSFTVLVPFFLFTDLFLIFTGVNGKIVYFVIFIAVAITGLIAGRKQRQVLLYSTYLIILLLLVLYPWGIAAAFYLAYLTFSLKGLN